MPRLRLSALRRSFGIVLGASMMPVWAQSGIYTCTDSRGRKITSDRPILECIDREQKELNPSGTIRRTVDPSYTAHEQAEREEVARQRAAEEARVREERRRDRALLTRYPTIEVHAKERAEALTQIDAVIAAAKKRTDELNQQKGQIDAEYEFYKKDPSKAPNSLKRQRDDNDRSIVIQAKFIADQDGEKKRVNARFDEELVKLKELWGAQAAARAAAQPPRK